MWGEEKYLARAFILELCRPIQQLSLYELPRVLIMLRIVKKSWCKSTE